MVRLFLLLILALSVPAFSLQISYQEYPELGIIHWQRDYKTALNLSRKTGKPVLILFQEIPGCSTCVNYGKKILSHPLMAEVIEENFIPLAVFNNRTGPDRVVLDKYGEPAWNNPVIRIVDKNGNDIVPRLNGDYTPSGIGEKIVQTLHKIGKKVPVYLNIIQEEFLALDRTDTAYFSMFCFWTGELELGPLPGVVATRSGTVAGYETVEVIFDTTHTDYKTLLLKALSLKCADRVFTLNKQQNKTASDVLPADKISDLDYFTPDSEIKYYLMKSPYRFLPLSPRQQILINRSLYDDNDPQYYLSPRQIQLLDFVEDHPEFPWKVLGGKNSELSILWTVCLNQTGFQAFHLQP